MDSGQVGPVPGPSGGSGTAGEPTLRAEATAPEPTVRAGATAREPAVLAGATAPEPAVLAEVTAGDAALLTGSASQPWPDGDPSGLVESCSEAELSELADESCLAVTAADEPCLTVAVADAPCLNATADGPSSCRAREVLARVGDKWSVYVIDLLGQDTKRFTELHRSIDGITARMLTVTLRGLERDGIVTRTIHPVIPPRVEYALTPMGQTLLTTIGQLVAWADGHVYEIEAARAAYDARRQLPLG
jgi:DNA-binding HxlR family transcriptional regulator